MHATADGCSTLLCLSGAVTWRLYWWQRMQQQASACLQYAALRSQQQQQKRHKQAAASGRLVFYERAAGIRHVYQHQ